MKGIIFFVFVLFASLIFSQEIPVKRTKTFSYVINEKSLIFDKETGSRIEFKDFSELLRVYPNADIKTKEEDLYGNPISFYFIKNPNIKESESKNETIEIIRKDIFGNIFNLQNINSKYILIILQIDLEFPMVNIEDIKEAENAAINRGYTSVILTESSLNQAKEFAQIQGLKSSIIPNALTLIHKFNFKRFPMYLVLDNNKSIRSSFKYPYKVEDELKSFD